MSAALNAIVGWTLAEETCHTAHNCEGALINLLKYKGQRKSGSEGRFAVEYGYAIGRCPCAKSINAHRPSKRPY